MYRYPIVSMFFVALVGCSPGALAFKLNPCLRILTFSDTGLAQRAINGWNPCAAVPERLQSTVHEHMTLAAIYKYRGVPIQRGVAKGAEKAAINYMRERSWKVGNGPNHETFGLMFGTWWNDDPMMHLWGEWTDFGSGVKHLQRLFSGKAHISYAGGVAGCTVPADQHLAYASHFGKLQHLHFMTSLGRERPESERLETTIEDALAWIEFAYKVAIGEIAATAPLTHEDEQRLKMPSVARNLCLKDPRNVKVRSVFTRQGPSTSVNIEFRNRLTLDVALGSIFHLLQDSFSPAHACRVEMQSEGKAMAVLRRVFNYNEQDHKEHAAQDGYPAWLTEYARTGVHRYANDPVATGAWLLRAVDDRMPWDQVRMELLSTIFKTEPSGQTHSTSACI